MNAVETDPVPVAVIRFRRLPSVCSRSQPVAPSYRAAPQRRVVAVEKAAIGSLAERYFQVATSWPFSFTTVGRDDYEHVPAHPLDEISHPTVVPRAMIIPLLDFGSQAQASLEHLAEVHLL